jgi:hypothetical protein
LLYQFREDSAKPDSCCEGSPRFVTDSSKGSKQTDKQQLWEQLLEEPPSLLAHLSLLEGSATREAAPGLHRGQKVCPTTAISVTLEINTPGIFDAGEVLKRDHLLSTFHFWNPEPMRSSYRQ